MYPYSFSENPLLGKNTCVKNKCNRKDEQIENYYSNYEKVNTFSNFEYVENVPTTTVEISEVPSKIVNYKSLKNQKNNQNNSKVQSNSTVEVNTTSNITDESKPVNWKLQKLEKDFLIKYLEKALQRYDKRTCKQKWIPSRHKNYFPNNYFNNPRQDSVGDDNQMPHKRFSTLKRKKIRTSIQRANVQHDCTQTEVMDGLPLSYEDYRNLIRNSHMIICTLNSVLKEQNLKPLQLLNKNEVSKYYNMICYLYGGLRGSDIEDHESILNKEIIFKSEETVSKDLFLQKTNLQHKHLTEEKEKSNLKLKKNGNKQKRWQEQPENVIPTITEGTTDLSVTKTQEDIKITSLMISENYASVDGNSKPPLTTNILDEIVVNKSKTEEEICSQPETKILESKDNSDEIIDEEYLGFKKETQKNEIIEETQIRKELKKKLLAMRQDINNYLKEGNENIKEVSENKKKLYSTLILISEALNRSCYKVPFNDDVSSAFSQSLSTIQTDARLTRNSVINKVAKDILHECDNLCKYFYITKPNEDVISETLDSIKELINETGAVVDQFVLNIFEEASVLKEFISFTHYLIKNFDHALLTEYINNVLEPTLKEKNSSPSNTNTENSIKDPVNEILENPDLLSNALAIIQIWSKKNYDSKKLSIENPSVAAESNYAVSNDYSLAITYNSEDVHSDLEKVKQWITDLSENLLEMDDIVVVYDEFVKTTNTTGIEKLRNVFADQDLLNKLIKNMPLSPDICLKANEICKSFKNLITSENITVFQDDEGRSSIISELLYDPALIRQFMSIVNYLNIENEEENLENFCIKEDHELIKEYFSESKSNMLIKLYKLSNWLSRLDKHCIFSDVPQYNAMNEIVVSNILNVIRNVDLHPVNQKIFNDSKLLSEAIGSIRAYITSEMPKTDHSQSGISLKHSEDELPNSEINELPQTVSLSFYPEKSKCKGKNHRYSNSEAQNINLTNGLNLESTSQNVTSINNLLSVMESIPDPLIKPLNFISKTLEDIKLEIAKTSKDSFFDNSPDIFIVTNEEPIDSVIEMNQENISIDHATTVKTEENKKTFNFDETNKYLQKVLSKGSSDKLITFKSLPPVIQMLQSIDETDTNIGIIQTDNDDENIEMENKTDFLINLPTDEIKVDHLLNDQDFENIDLEKIPPEIIYKKESINSQLNAVIMKLDDAIASVDSKYQSDINQKLEIETYAEKKGSDIGIGLLNTTILFLDDQDTVLKLYPNSQFNLENDQSFINLQNDKIKVDHLKNDQYFENIDLEKIPPEIIFKKESINSQLNAVVVKLDDAIVSIDFKHQSNINKKLEIETYAEKKGSDIGSGFLNTTILFLDNKDKMSKLGYNSQLNLKKNQSLTSVDDTLNAEADLTKFSQATSFDTNMCFENNDKESEFILTCDDPIKSHKAKITKITEKEPQTDISLKIKSEENILPITINAQDNINLEEFFTINQEESYIICPTKFENNEMKNVNTAKDQKLDNFISELTKNPIQGVAEGPQSLDSTRENALIIHVLSNDTNTPLINNEFIIFDEIERESNVNLKNEISNLASRLDEAIVTISIISHDLYQIRYREPQYSIPVSEKYKNTPRSHESIIINFKEDPQNMNKITRTNTDDAENPMTDRKMNDVVLNQDKTVIPNVTKSTNVGFVEKKSELSLGKSCETIELSIIKSDNEFKNLSEELFCETKSDLKAENCIDFKWELSESSKDTTTETITLSNKISEKDKEIDLEVKTSEFSDKSNPIQMEDIELVDIKEPKLSFNSQLHTLASKLEDAMASIDIKYQEMKDIEMEIPMLNIPAILNKVIILDDVENRPNISFKSQINNLALKLDESNALIDQIQENIQSKNIPNQNIIGMDRADIDHFDQGEGEPGNLKTNLSQISKDNDIERNSQVTQTEKSHNQEIPNDTGNNLLANDTVTTLGFIVYYLLIILAARQSRDDFI